MLKISITAAAAFLSLLRGNCNAQNINVSAPFSITTSSGSFGGGGFGLNFARGGNRTSTTTTPSLTTQNGSGGTLFSGQVTPFTTGVVPVVGQGGGFGGGAFGNSNFVELPSGPDNGVTRALQSGQLNLAAPPRPEFKPSGPINYSASQSTATSGGLSVNSIKAERERRIAAQSQVINGIVESAQQLEQQRQFAMARLKYREALSLTTDRQTRNRINALIKATRLKD